jgi:hypothetical protein
MTQKDYIKIADVLARCKFEATTIEAHQAIETVQVNLALVLKCDNSRFDMFKFSGYIERRVDELQTRKQS